MASNAVDYVDIKDQENKSQIQHLSGFYQGHEVFPECEVIDSDDFDGESDRLETQYKDCKKNPGHVRFVPVNEFGMEHLPHDLRNKETMDLVLNRCFRTVKIKVAYTSFNRPDRFSDFNAPYPYKQFRGSKKAVRYGTGCVSRVLPKPITDKPCPCPLCVTSEQPKILHWLVTVSTATHVIYDDSEAQHAVVDCFYDSDNAEDDIRKLYGHCVDGTNMSIHKMYSSDVSHLLCITHDSDLVEKLSAAVDGAFDIRNALNHSQPPSEVIVSHPHGCSKRITVGNTHHVTVPIKPDYNTNTPTPLKNGTICRLPLKPWKMDCESSQTIKREKDSNVNSDKVMDDNTLKSTVDNKTLKSTILQDITKIDQSGHTTQTLEEHTKNDVGPSVPDDSSDSSVVTPASDIIKLNKENGPNQRIDNYVDGHELPSNDLGESTIDHLCDFLGNLMDNISESESSDFQHHFINSDDPFNETHNFKDQSLTNNEDVRKFLDSAILNSNNVVHTSNPLATESVSEGEFAERFQASDSSRCLSIFKSAGLNEQMPLHLLPTLKLFQSAFSNATEHKEEDESLTVTPNSSDKLDGMEVQQGSEVGACIEESKEDRDMVKNNDDGSLFSLLKGTTENGIMEMMQASGFGGISSLLPSVKSIITMIFQNVETPPISFDISNQCGKQFELPSGMTFTLSPEAEYLCRYNRGSNGWFMFPPGTTFTLVDGTTVHLPEEAEFKNESFHPQHCYVTYDTDTCPGSSGSAVHCDLHGDPFLTYFPHSGSMYNINRSGMQQNPLHLNFNEVIQGMLPVFAPPPASKRDDQIPISKQSVITPNLD